MSDIPTLVTYGGGDILSHVFNGIAALVGDDAYKTVLRLVGLIALLWVLAEVTVTTNYIKLLTWLSSFYLLLNVLLVPKITVVIEDKLNNNAVYTVDNVPLGVGYLAVVTSQIGYVLTSLCDTVFSLPDDLQYSQTGLVMGSKLVSDAMRFQITDSTFSQNMGSFMQQCVFYDLLLGKYTPTDLFTANDIWGFITQNASPARAFKYVTGAGVGSSATIYTCHDGVSTLNADWNKEIQQAATVYGQRFFATSSVNAKSELLSRLPIAMNYLTQTSQSAEEIMMQAMTANALQSALLSNSAQSGASAAVGQYASTRAEQMQMSKFLISGDLAAHWLSIMQNVIQALLYGGFIIVLLTMLLPKGHAVILHYLQSLLWVQLWAPLYAILNLVITMGAGHESMAAIADMGGAASNFTLNTYAGLAKVNADMAAFAGFATLSIPLIAWGLVKFTGLTVTSLASSLASVSQSVASRVGDEVTSGNLSYGNLQYETQSAFNTSANNFNTNATYQAGMSSYQAPSGAMVQHTQDGSTVINSQGAISSTGTSINLADSMRSQASLQADKAQTAAYNQALSYSQSMSSAFREVHDLSNNQGKYHGADSGYSLSKSASVANSVDSIKQVSDRFAKDHHLSQDETARILGDAYAKVSGGAPIAGLLSAGAGVQLDANISGSASKGDTWRDAMDTVSQSSFRHNVDNVMRVAHDEHLKGGQDESSRMLQGIGETYDKALHYRDDSSNSLSMATAYRQTASFATENAVSINTNTSQAFVDWMIAKPDGHGGTLGSAGAEAILDNQPGQARALANEFVGEQVNHLSQQFMNKAEGMGALNQENTYQAVASGFTASSVSEISTDSTANSTTLQSYANQKGITGTNLQTAETNISSNVNHNMHGDKNELHDKKTSLDHSITETDKEKSHLSDNSHSLLRKATGEAGKNIKEIL